MRFLISGNLSTREYELMRNPLHGLKSDESLMLAYQRGDSSALDSLYLRHKDSLFSFLYRNCQESAVVEELAHDAWTSIIRSVAAYKPTAKFRTYLFSVAHNKLVDHWRRQKNKGASVGIDEIDPQKFRGHESANDEPGPELNLIRREQEEILHAALALLPVEQRDAFLLREEGFTQEQIADIVGVGKETVKSRLRYAATHLRTVVENSLRNTEAEILGAVMSGAKQ
jgi:RNA polymerase sigma-70 factor (ECF subfamily)